MKNKYVLLTLAFLAAIVLQSTAAPKKASMKIEEKTYDFGLIGGKQTVSHEFEFENTGMGNLVILGAKSECGCTKPLYPRAPIPPSGRGRIKVTFNPAGYRGAFHKSVTLTTNGSPKKVKVHIKGAVR